MLEVNKPDFGMFVLFFFFPVERQVAEKAG